MGYSLLAIAEKDPNWEEVHSKVFDPDSAIEMFPIDEGDGKSYLGISIPSSKLSKHPDTWEKLEKTINTLRQTFNFDVFDLYGGFFIDDQNLSVVKSQLLG